MFFCVRWVDEDFISHEDFIGLYEMEKTTATSMAFLINPLSASVALI